MNNEGCIPAGPRLSARPSDAFRQASEVHKSTSHARLPLVQVIHRAVGFGPMRFAVSDNTEAIGLQQDLGLQQHLGLRQNFTGARGLDDLSLLTGTPRPRDNPLMPADIVGPIRGAGLRLLARTLPCLPCSRQYDRIDACLRAVQAPPMLTDASVMEARTDSIDSIELLESITLADRLARFASLRDACESFGARRFIAKPLIAYERHLTRHDQPYCIRQLSFSLRVGTVEVYRQALSYASPQSVFNFNAAVAAAGLDVRGGLMLQAQVLKHKMLSESCHSPCQLDTSRLTALDRRLAEVNALEELAYAPTAALMQQLQALAAMLKDQRIWTHVDIGPQPSSVDDPEGFRIDVTMQIPIKAPLFCIADRPSCAPTHVTVPVFTVSLGHAQRHELPSILKATIAIMTSMAPDRNDIFQQAADFLSGLQPTLTDAERSTVLASIEVVRSADESVQ